MTMNTRGIPTPGLASSAAIRHEIQRFESVHPSIYAIYDLIEAIPDPLIQQQIREHVVCIEDSFVNSQEWTVSRAVPDLKLGILGTVNSGKSALVHRYLTGSYMQEESPEGGRFKKEVMLEGLSNLLLIRDEGGPPEMQFTQWVDAVIFVFSLENEMSFNAVYQYYAKMAHYRNIAEIPIILVGTQDAISESNPRVIDDSRARKLANDLKRCSYYETCATYGLNVERVFQDACQKIVQLKAIPLTPNNSRPSTPNHSASTMRGYYTTGGPQGTPQSGAPPQGPPSGSKPGYESQTSSSQSTSGSGNLTVTPPSQTQTTQQGHSPPFREQVPREQVPGSRDKEKHKHDKKHRDRDKDRDREREQLYLTQQQQQQQQADLATVGGYPHRPHGGSHAMPVPIPTVPPPTSAPPLAPHDLSHELSQQSQVLDFRDLPTPGSTPIPSRKNKKSSSVQKSNSFSGPALLQRVQQQLQQHQQQQHLQQQQLQQQQQQLPMVGGGLSPVGTPQPYNGGGPPQDYPTPTSTPILSRKNKNNKSFISPLENAAALITADTTSGTPVPSSSALTGSAGLTPLLGRKEPRYRFSLIVDRMDSFLRDFPVSKDSPLTPILSRIPRVRSSLALDQATDYRDLPTPTSTPTPTRKNRRRSNLFTGAQKKGEEEKKVKNGETVGSGRTIPTRQGYLYKKSNKPLNKDWKKKYVTLNEKGRLTYHPSLHDYMSDVHGKEINLQRTTVKVPGQRPRAARISSDSQAMHTNGSLGLKGKDTEGIMLTGYEMLGDSSVVIPNTASIAPGLSNGMDVFTSVVMPQTNPTAKIDTPNVKKRHRRAKSGAKTLDASQDGADSDGYEFVIVSLDNKSWHFEAQTTDEREEWVAAIEQSILFSLQGNESNKQKDRTSTISDPQARQSIRTTKGNNICVDCDSPNPDWASLNLGALMCIECSGIHRNLGTHISRVRSLDLDEWPPELVTVMTSIGNTMANRIWEVNFKGSKPSPTSSREEKEVWIRAKYEGKEFLPPPPYLDVPLPQQLIDAIARQDVHNTVLVLAYTKTEHVNAPYSKTDTRTALHIAAALGNTTLVQELLWYGANVKMVDHEGRNALWYAKSSGCQECVDLLRCQGCPENPTIPRRRGSNQPHNSSNNNSGAPPGGGPPGEGDAFDKLPASVI